MTHTSPFWPLLDLVDGRGTVAQADLEDAMMARALAEAWKGVGRTRPNPPVGAVVAHGDQIVGVGHHQQAGLAHGEVNALDQAGDAARGGVLYVTLEPCVHVGRTPPCVLRVIRSGVKKVVVGAGDPNPKVDGKGVRALRDAGLEVIVRGEGRDDDPIARAARALIAPFAAHVLHDRPFVVVKVAATLDGKIATAAGKSRFITGPSSRALVHGLRDRCDVVMTGSGTVLADDPALTVRDSIEGATGTRDPLRVVLDTQLRTNPAFRVYAAPSSPGGEGALVVTASRPPDARARAFEQAGVPRLEDSPKGRHVDIGAALRALAARGATSVLVEAGPEVTTALLRAGLVDEIWWFTAPVFFGGDGRSATAALGVDSVDEAPRLAASVRRVVVGEDLLTVGVPAR